VRTSAEWDTWYARANPWGTEGSDEDCVRTELLLERLRHARFAHMLDLGCGEGRLTDALSRVAENTYGFDISPRAIDRARARFPHIRFQEGDLLDVIQRPQVVETPFDFISLSEVLYYFQTDEERHAALAGVSRIGAPACLYYFSVMVVGASKYRRYFTHDEFVRMVSEHFHVIDSFGSVAEVPRIIRYLPFRRRRLALIKALTVTRRPEQCRHMGYFAVKRNGGSHR
jgi:SAM-dependent methyltransferase